MSTMWRSAMASMSRAGWFAVAGIALALITLTTASTALVKAFLVRGADSTASQQQQTERLARFNEAFDRQLTQFGGRMAFYPLPPPPEPKTVEEVKVEGPPPKPTSYNGPEIIALIGDTVWFKDGQVLHVGEKGSGELEVVEPRGPWSAVLRWRGVEFDVPLFERTTQEFLETSQIEKD